VTLELQEHLERPLLGPGAATWKDQPREMPEEYEKWVDAQIISEEASKHIANYKDTISPLTKTRAKNVLETMWKCVNLVSIFSFTFHGASDEPISSRTTNLSRAERILTHYGNLMVP
jgi:hypothetical protein